MKAFKPIGILREMKNKWDRREAITTSEIHKSVNSNMTEAHLQRKAFSETSRFDTFGTLTELKSTLLGNWKFRWKFRIIQKLLY